MERSGVSSWFPLFLFAVFMVLRSAAAQNEEVYTAVNGNINLKPESSGPFTNILWKHQGNLVVEWVNNDLEYYGMFRGRTTLDTTTGGLVIKNTNDSFAGPYTVELNSQVQSKGYDVKFIKEVTKPEVDQKPLACTRELKECKLVCLHYESSTFGPLTYSWKEDSGDWILGDREMPINDEKTQGVKTFSCRVKNPINEAESDPRPNPFYQDQTGDSSPAVGIGVGITAVLAVIAGVVFAWWRGLLKCLPENLQPQRGRMNLPANSNGNAGNQPPGEADPLKMSSSPREDTNKTPPMPNDDNPADPPNIN